MEKQQAVESEQVQQPKQKQDQVELNLSATQQSPGDIKQPPGDIKESPGIPVSENKVQNPLFESPKVEEKQGKPKTKEKKEQVDPEIVRSMRDDYVKLRESHDSLLASIEKAREHRTVQVIRAAGVEGLADEEIIQLAPKVDPNSPDGISKINEWISNHPALVSPKYRMQAPDPKQLAESAMENHAVKSIFGNAETVRTRIKTIFGGE